MIKQKSISWSELADLTHITQVDRFEWCWCEGLAKDEHPYDDCTGE